MKAEVEDVSSSGNAKAKVEDKHEAADSPSNERKLNKGQRFVCSNTVDNRINAFLTGGAGTGKTFLLSTLIGEMQQKYGPAGVAVTSSTGISASILNGRTLHSFVGATPRRREAETIVEGMSEQRIMDWKRVVVLVIDEASMVHPHFFVQMDRVARAVRDSSLPMGSIQVVITADMAQLPPIGTGRLKYIFETSLWKDLQLYEVSLTEKMRQQHKVFGDMLDEIRVGRPSKKTSDLISSLTGRSKLEQERGGSPVILAALKHVVRKQNQQALDRLEGKTCDYLSIDAGPFKEYPEQARQALERVMMERKLTLKVGCRVMLIKNYRNRLFNGMQGTVLAFVTEEEWRRSPLRNSSSSTLGERVHLEENYDHSGFSKPGRRRRSNKYVVVQFDAKTARGLPEIHLVRVDTFTEALPVIPVKQGKTGVQEWLEVRRQQIPLILSYAITIHKAQGQTFELVHAVLDGTFCAGQVYVALSRATSLDGLQVTGWDPKKVTADGKAVRFHEKVPTVEQRMEELARAERAGTSEKDFFARWRVPMNAEKKPGNLGVKREVAVGDSQLSPKRSKKEEQSIEIDLKLEDLIDWGDDWSQDLA